MDIFSVSASTITPRFSHSATLFSSSASSSSSSSATAANSVSFSLKPPPPPPPADEPANPTNSPSLRRRKAVKPTSSFTPTPAPIPTTPKFNNPRKTVLTTSTTSPSPSPSKPTNPYTRSFKHWLSSKLSTPSPLPPPPPPLQENHAPETETREGETQENETHSKAERVRQEGKIFVGNLPNWIMKHEVSEFFRQFGPIKNVILIKGHNKTEKNAGFGFVIYDGPTAEMSATKAVEFDGVEFHGRVLTVKLDDGGMMSEQGERRKRWVAGEDEEERRSNWREEREGSRQTFRQVLETQPKNWQAVVSAFENIKEVNESLC